MQEESKGFIKVPYCALTLKEALYLLLEEDEQSEGHFDSKGFVMLDEGDDN